MLFRLMSLVLVGESVSNALDWILSELLSLNFN